MEEYDKEAVKVPRAHGKRQVGCNHDAPKGKNGYLHEDVKPLVGNDEQRH